MLTVDDLSPSAIFELALGRILRLGSRPTQPGDVEEYERCRVIILDLFSGDARPDWTPSYARDRLGSLLRGD